jgi:uncharacterized protein (TIGR02145 family)
MTQLRDLKKFLSLNSDDTPANLQEGEVIDILNSRLGSSSEEHGSGNLETLQGEIEVLIAPKGSVLYYGSAIGSGFIYSGYDEIAIGTQVWMRKNWDANYPGSKVYDDDEDNRPIYGGLYTHNQIMSTDFCPAGWRVPTEADIDILLTYLGGLMLAGGNMKNVGTGLWLTPNTGAADSAGFKAVPGGKFDLLFELLGENCLLWLQDDGVPVAPVALNGSEITAVSFVANWEAADGATGYRLDVSTSPVFASFVAGYNNKDVGNVLVTSVTGLSGTTNYYYRVRAYNEVGTSDNSNTETLQTKFAYNDYFLPSKDGYQAMNDELHLHGLGGFSNGHYWTSSEYSSTNAILFTFVTGLWNNDPKSNTYYVRACRAFTSITNYNLRDIGPAGGLIFYKSGNDYLEAAPIDQSVNQVWSNITNIAIGTTGETIGSGQANTTAIIGQVGHTDSAAKLCNDLII